MARLDANEGAITRVGTNIYSAPEHNPLMQTGQLDTARLRTPRRDYLTPAADIYSLAKTTYSLLAGEPPRRFAQHAITELPEVLKDAGRVRSCASSRKRRKAVQKIVIKVLKSFGRNRRRQLTADASVANGHGRCSGGWTAT